MVNKKKCRVNVMGTVKEVRVKTIKIGFLPIVQRSYPVIGDKQTGDEVKICYNPDNPAEAYIAGNEGFATA